VSALEAIDRVDVQIIVDNVTDNLSSVPRFVETEFASLGRRRQGKWVLGGACLCCAAHGLSCLITISNGAHQHSMLFDTGPEDHIFERNVSRLGLDLSPVQNVVLSHGHWDHAGAMLRALQIIRDRNGGREIACYTHPDMFRTRALRMPTGKMVPMQDVPSVEDLTDFGARVVNTTEPQLILGGTVYISGEIARHTPFEQGFPEQHRKTLDGEGWEPDPLTMDERFVAVNVADKGLVVFTACSHAGIINILDHAKAEFPDLAIYGVVGGLHLAGANEKIIPETIDAMRQFNLSIIAAGHCTGWRAMTALAKEFGDQRLVPLAVGKRYTWASPSIEM
jgi:7,8-dihydropterin-6-yl-methyl-4-(beta-D-ribofuranosyl)aminobenzene 5'-phosphate synthase